MRTESTLPPWLKALLVGGAFAGMAWLERRRPPRRQWPEPEARREARNLAIAAPGGATVPRVLAMHYGTQRDPWRLPDGGVPSRPERGPATLLRA